MVGDQGTAALSEFATECNCFLRELGCEFSGDMPGSILEEMAEEARCLKPRNQSFVSRISTHDCHFIYRGVPLKKLLDMIWAMLGLPTYKHISDEDFLVAKQRAVGVLRVFRELANKPLADARDHAFRFLELSAQRSGAEKGEHVAP